MHTYRLLQWHRVNGVWKAAFWLIYATSCKWPKAGFISKELCVLSNRKFYISWAHSTFKEWGHNYLKLQVLYSQSTSSMSQGCSPKFDPLSTVLTSSWGYFVVAEVEGMEISLFTPNRGEHGFPKTSLKSVKKLPNSFQKTACIPTARVQSRPEAIISRAYGHYF